MPELAKRPGPLAHLSQDEVRALLACGTPRGFRIDEVVLEQGRTNGSLFIIVDGMLHVRRSGPQGKSVLLGRLEPGSFFGEISLFDPGPTTAAVVGVSAGELVAIRREQLENFGRAHPRALADLLTGLLEEVTHRLRRMDDRLVDAILWGGLLR